MTDTFIPYKEGQSGGEESRLDPRDHKWEEIGGAPLFDWNKGYDIEAELGMQLPTKDQGDSFSCGGQAGGYYGSVKERVVTGTYETRSAKFIYSQIFVPPAGGAFMRDIFAIATKQGFAEETLCSSYENGGVPSENFMRRPQDITAMARENALRFKGVGYALVPNTIDATAAAVAVNHGAIILFRGTNNGTWYSEFPQAPVGRGDWGHFVYVGKARLIEGKKYLGIKNSWGNKCGVNGWQWIGEDFFSSGNIIECRTLYVKPKFEHYFGVNLTHGMNNAEVKALQQGLKEEGSFTYPSITGYYGNVTAQAVLDFQKKYAIAPLPELIQLGGKQVGPKTRAKLNELFGS